NEIIMKFGKRVFGVRFWVFGRPNAEYPTPNTEYHTFT
ncbi:MAG: hypothetical protein ACI8X3_003454, partial [Saprospiraceae bacterium]